MCNHSRLNPKLEGIDLGLLHWANIYLIMAIAMSAFLVIVFVTCLKMRSWDT